MGTGAQRELFSNGQKLDLRPASFGSLEDANDIVDDSAALGLRMQKDGYVLLRGLLGKDTILAARREILLKYAIIGEIETNEHSLMEGVFSEDSLIDKVNLYAFTESVRTGKAYERVVHNEALFGVLARIFEDDVHCFDFKWSRLVRPGETCGLHCDAPYVNRGSRNVVTAWIPLGDLPREEGALMILEGSHLNEKVIRNYANKDSDRDNLGWLSTNPGKLRKNLGGRWLTTDFGAGDVLLFSMNLVHGAIDNRSPKNRCRLTSDTRYQPAADPLDDRWNGDNPLLHGPHQVFLPGLGNWNNHEFRDEWKPVDERGRLIT